MNGIQISGTAEALIEGNTISGHLYIDGPDALFDEEAAGILLYVGTAELRGNILQNNEVSVYNYQSSASIVQNLIDSNVRGIKNEDGETEIYANNITNNEYGIDVYSGDSTSTITAFNRIVDNFIGLDNQLETALEAPNNWWGCNTGPDTTGCDTTNGLVEAETWLVLTLSADADKVTPGSPVNLTATITTNSDGVDVSGADEFPNGKEIDFTTTLGAMSPVSDPLAGGSAFSTLSVASVQTPTNLTVSARLDNQTVTLELLADLVRIWLPIMFNSVR